MGSFIIMNSLTAANRPLQTPIEKKQNESRVQESPEDKLDITPLLWKETQILIL
jgi:hypothetical protein